MGRAHEVRKVAMAKTAAVKSKLYAKYGKEIYMTAKSGIPDPDVNQSLKKIIEKAKKESVPADVIKRAIEKAKGGSEENYIESRYEGFGPGNSLVIVDCLTDNVNRTFAEVRNCFTKTGGKLGVSGSCMHMFNHHGLLSFEGLGEEEVLEILINADVDAIDVEYDDGLVTVVTEPANFEAARDALVAAKEDLEFLEDKVTFVPMTIGQLNEEDLPKFNRMLDMLNELDDVQDIYHNIGLE